MLHSHLLRPAYLVLAALFSVPVAAPANPSGKALSLDLSAPPEQLSSGLVAKDAAKLRNARKVIISNFRVVLVSESDATGTASAGLGGKGSASQTVFYKLVNLDAAKLQAMADAAYGSWQESLRAAGYEVLSPSVLAGQNGAEKLAGDATLTRFQMIELGGVIGMMVTPTGVPIKEPLGAFATDAAGRKVESALATGADAAKVANATGKAGVLGKFGAIGGTAANLTKTAKGMGSVTGAIGDAGAIAKLSDQLGAALVSVTVVVNFVDLKASGRGFLERMAGSEDAVVSATTQPTFVANDTVLSVVNGNATATIVLSRPVVLAGDAISEIRDATTALDTAGNITGAVVSGVLAMETGGGLHSNKVNRREAVASEHYGEVVGANLAVLGQAMAQSMSKR
jgi:hypothetical protein